MMTNSKKNLKYEKLLESNEPYKDLIMFTGVVEFFKTKAASIADEIVYDHFGTDKLR